MCQLCVNDGDIILNQYLHLRINDIITIRSVFGVAKITKKDKRRLLIWTMLILVVGSYLGVFVYKYWSQIFDNYNEKTILEEKYQALLETEKELNGEVIKLHDPEYIAKFAREKFMYSKPGELILRLPGD